MRGLQSRTWGGPGASLRIAGRYSRSLQGLRQESCSRQHLTREDRPRLADEAEKVRAFRRRSILPFVQRLPNPAMDERRMRAQGWDVSQQGRTVDQEPRS